MEVEADGPQPWIKVFTHIPVSAEFLQVLLPQIRVLDGLQGHIAFPVRPGKHRVALHQSIQHGPVLRVAFGYETDRCRAGFRVDVADGQPESAAGRDGIRPVPHEAVEVVRNGVGTTDGQLAVPGVTPFR